MSVNALPAGTRITLAFSARTGIVAVTGGTRYRDADTVLDTAGFSRRQDGTSTLATADTGAARRALTALTRLVADHNMTLTASSRVWLGDTATRIATLLPGSWTARIEVYAMPVWQQDLAECLWDAGTLIGAVRNERISLGAVLTDGRGTELLVVDTPGAADELLIGAFAPNGLDGPFADDPSAPPSMAVPADPALAAQAITTRLLPAFRLAVYQRRASEVAGRLAHALAAEIARILVRGSWPADDGTGIGAVILSQVDHAHHEALWDDFRSFLLHGPALLDHVEAVAVCLRPADRAVLPALREALRQGCRVHGQWLDTVRRMREDDSTVAGTTYTQAVARRTTDAGPALAAWLEHGPTLVDLARQHPPAGARPVAPRALPAASPAGPPVKRRGSTS